MFTFTLTDMITLKGDDFLEDSLYFESGPFGSNNDGTWFTDFRQMLDGSRFEPRHWPDTINLRAGQGIDGYV